MPATQGQSPESHPKFLLFNLPCAVEFICLFGKVERGLECGKTFLHLGWKHRFWMMWKGLGSLVCDTMSMCSPSRGLTTGFQASLQHLENNLRGHPRVGSNPRPRVSCLVLYPLGHCDEIKVHAWTIPDISLSHRSAIIAD